MSGDVLHKNERVGNESRIEVRRIPNVSDDQESSNVKNLSFSTVYVRPSVTDGAVYLDDYIASKVAQYGDAEFEETRKQIANEIIESQGDADLRGLRMLAGLSQSQLADLVGSTQSRVSRLESGLDNPRLETIEKWCAALDCDVDAFYKAWKICRIN